MTRFSLAEYLEDRKLFIIAEMSCNHAGNIEKAKEIIKAAKWAGADAVKIQTYTPDCMTLNRPEPEFSYQGRNDEWRGRRLWDIYQDAHTPIDWHSILFSYARKEGILLFSSPFSSMGLDVLGNLDCPLYKIASFEANHFPLVEKIAKTGRPCIISTGAIRDSDLRRTYEIFHRNNNLDLGLLHCVSEYPANPEGFFLKRIPNLKRAFSLPIGLSDHSIGNEMAVSSVALGGTIIEKHLKLFSNDVTLDASFSCTPVQFKKMTEACRVVAKSINVSDEYYRVKKEAQKLSRSLYIVKDLKKGEVITEEHLGVLRPGIGLPPVYYRWFLGKVATQDLLSGISLKLNHVVTKF